MTTVEKRAVNTLLWIFVGSAFFVSQFFMGLYIYTVAKTIGEEEILMFLKENVNNDNGVENVFLTKTSKVPVSN